MAASAGLTTGYATNRRTEVTTTRVRDEVTTQLTNISTKSEAWGKIIPMGFGRHRVAGALVWGSQFYKTTQSFDDVTTTKSIVTWQSVSTGRDAVARGGSIFSPVVNEPEDVVYNSGSQVTHGEAINSYIDLCYSFGTEGDTRKKRYIEKIRVNDTIIYDTTIGYIADGIGFSIRYGYDDAPPALMSKYPNGKFHYKGQTLVCFDRFPLALFGNSIPDTVDVEFGCCGLVPAGCGPEPVYEKQLSRDYAGAAMFTDGAGYSLAVGDIMVAICVVSKPANGNGWVNNDWQVIASQSGTDLDVSLRKLVITDAILAKYKDSIMQLITPHVDGQQNYDPGTAQDRVCGWLHIFKPHNNPTAYGTIDIVRAGSTTFMAAPVFGPAYNVAAYFGRDSFDNLGEGSDANTARFTPQVSTSTPVVGVQTDRRVTTLDGGDEGTDLVQDISCTNGREYAIVRYTVPFISCGVQVG